MTDKVYEIVTNQIIERLEEGTVPWQKPWKQVPYNLIYGREYHGLNLWMLPYSGGYLTYKQARDIGAHVKKGEHGHKIVFWKIIHKKTKDEVTGEEKKDSIPLLRYYTVFHESQVEDIPEDKISRIEGEEIEDADTVIREYGEREGIEFNTGQAAFYSPTRDSITLPYKESFRDIGEYYHVAFHEMGHSTGHKKRLNRFGTDVSEHVFGSESYSKEELVAEMTAGFVATRTGVEFEIDNSAAYLKSWIDALKGDSHLIISASSKAEKAANYIVDGKKPEAK